jgi:FSR family fosmidomycin resistance protein-like MFS transporter
MRPGAEVTAAVPVSVRAARASLWMVGLLSLGHFCVDLYSGALGALQPLLVARFGLSLTQAGILGGALVFSSSLMQPLYGLLSDRLHTRLFAALGPAVAGIFISSLGLAPGFWTLLVMTCLGGVGIAAFHPQGSALATAGVEGRRGRVMAVFVSAGTLGYSLGPTYFSLVAAALGLSGMWWAALPGLATSALLLRRLPPAARQEGKRRAPGRFEALASAWRPLSILYLLVFLRSVVQITYAQLLPLYLSRERGYSVPAASYTLSAYLLCGALGGFLGGHLADRLGGRRVILMSMAGSAPFLALFFLTRGALSVGALLAGGLILLFTIPVNVVMAQELIPSQAGTVSALMMGFAWGLAGILFIPLTGLLADRFSMHYALAAWTVFPVLGFLLALRLPK